MAKIILKDQQAALILSASEDCLDLEVDIAYEGQLGMAAGLCEVIARRLIEDESFRHEMLTQVKQNAAEDF